MNPEKRARLEAAGFRVATVGEFLALSPEESALIETKLALAKALRHQRQAAGISQQELAIKLRSSQSRVAKMESADKSVSAELLLKALFAVGLKPAEVGAVLTG